MSVDDRPGMAACLLAVAVPPKPRRPVFKLFDVEVNTYGDEAKAFFTKLADYSLTAEELEPWRPMVEACARAMQEVQAKGFIPGLLSIHGSGVNSVPTPAKGNVKCYPKKYHEYEDLKGDAVREQAMQQFEGASRFHSWPPRKPFVKMPDYYWAE